MVWTVPYGQGRVVVTTLGHDLLAMSQPGFIDLLVRGVEWAATGTVKPTAVVPLNLRVARSRQSSECSTLPEFFKGSVRL